MLFILKVYADVVDLLYMKQHGPRLIHLFPVILIGIYLFGFEYIPNQDYPDWLYEGFVFNQFFFHGNTFADYFQLHPYIPPNLISTLSIGVLALLFPVVTAGKIFLFATLLLLYFGIYRFFGFCGLKEKNLNIALAFYLTFNYHFFLGNINFLFGFGFALASFTLAAKHNKLQNVWWLVIIFLLLYLSHFFSLIIFAIILISYAEPGKRRQALSAAAIAAIPAVLLFCHYYFSKSLIDIYSDEFSTPIHYYLIAKLIPISIVQIPFHRFKLVSDTWVIMKIINYAVASFTILLAVYSAKRWIINKERATASTIVCICLLLSALLPLYLSGLYFPTERLVILMIIGAISHLVPRISDRRMFRFILPAVLILCIASYFWNLYNISKYNEMLIQGKIPPSMVQYVYFHRQGINPFQRLEYYQAIKDKEPLPIFTTGLFLFRGGSPKTFDGFTPREF